MAERKLIAVLPMLEEGLRARVRDAAVQRGFMIRFLETAEEALPQVADAEIIFGTSPELARHAPALRWFCTPFAGVDNFTAPGVFASPDAVLTNSSGAYGVTIAGHILMVTLEMLRHMPEYEEIVRSRSWVRTLPVSSIRDSRITLLGAGDIGREAAIRLRSFSPAALVGVNRSGARRGTEFDRVIPQTGLDAILPETDILIISLPDTAETRHMLDARRLAMLPDGALVVNVGRGQVIDTPALVAELQAGRLRAALDVFEQEPLPADDPIWDCPNLRITPHVAGNMTLPYTRRHIVEMFLEDLDNYCAGKPLAHQVDLKRGY